MREYTCPGGPSTLTTTLQRPPGTRTDATDPGRVVQAWRGASCVWEGILNEPDPQAGGSVITAHGAGTYPADYSALYTTWNADDAVNQAIARGMRLVNPGIGKPPGIWLGQQQDSGSQQVSDHLNLLCTSGGLLWYTFPGVTSTSPAGPRVLRLFPFKTDQAGYPTAPADRILIATSPVARSVTGDVTVLELRYQATADVQASPGVAARAATYATVEVTNAASVAKHGRIERFVDLSSAGVMTPDAVRAIGNNILTRFVRATWDGAFTAGPGQVLTADGVPVDLGMEEASLVYKVLFTDSPYGGEVAMAPLVFMSGTYSYDEGTGAATITPFKGVRGDISSLIAALYPGKSY